MSEVHRIERGRMGRVAYARIGPNEDLMQGVDQAAERPDGACQVIRGPAIEVVSLAGEVRRQPDGSLRSALTGVVADTEGRVYGGPFVAGANTVCVTFEVTLEEWLPADDDN